MQGAVCEAVFLRVDQLVQASGFGLVPKSELPYGLCVYVYTD